MCNFRLKVQNKFDSANFASLLVVMKGSHWHPEYVTCHKCLWTIVLNELNCSYLLVFQRSNSFDSILEKQVESKLVDGDDPNFCIRPISRRSLYYIVYEKDIIVLIMQIVVVTIIIDNEQIIICLFLKMVFYILFAKQV